MMTNEEIILRQDVLLTFQVALLGMVLPSLRGVTVGWDANEISALCLYDGNIGDIENELASDIEAEIIASFPEYKVNVGAESFKYPANLNNQTLKAWVYRRLEQL